MTADLTKEAREPLDDASKLLSVPVEEWTRGSAEGIVAAYVDNVPALLAWLEAAEAKLARMETALAPFAAVTNDEERDYPAESDFQRARAALQGEG